RTNAGYERWWEGRKLWGAIVNQSRNLAISTLAFATGTDRAWRERFTRWTAAFAHVARRTLRGERDVPRPVRLIGEESAPRVAKRKHMPMAVAGELARMLRAAADEGHLSELAFAQCDH